MKHYIRIIILIVCVLIISALIVMLLNPLRRSESDIRDMVLESIPIGTEMEDAIEIITNNSKWEVMHIDYEHGYNVSISYGNEEIVVGVKNMWIHLGFYRNIFRTDVTAYLGFDSNSKLIDVAVRKDTDSL